MIENGKVIPVQETIWYNGVEDDNYFIITWIKNGKIVGVKFNISPKKVRDIFYDSIGYHPSSTLIKKTY